jgi:hypothetical protein
MHPIRLPNATHGLRPPSLALVVLFALPLTMSCAVADRVAWLAAQVVARIGALRPSAIRKTVEMTAQGRFDMRSQEGWTIPSDLVKLSWKVDPTNGEVDPEVSGEGHRNTSSPDGETWANLVLEFSGTVTPDGEEFAGGVHVTGEQQWMPGNVEKAHNPADWTARRYRDIIIGTIDGMGPFRLQVDPLPAK